MLIIKPSELFFIETHDKKEFYSNFAQPIKLILC